MPMSAHKLVSYSKEPHDYQEVNLMLPSHINQTNEEGQGKGDTPLNYEDDTRKESFNSERGTSGSSLAAKEAFHLACVAGNVACVKLLLERGVLGNVNEAVCSFHGEEGEGPVTPLCCAATSARNAEVVQLLLDSGADVNFCSGRSKSFPLHAALAQPDNISTVQLLLKAGANHSAKDIRGHTPLHVAATTNDPQGLNLLLEAGADPSVLDDEGRTPLHAAVTISPTDRGEPLLECVRLLLEDGRVDINAQDCYGYTALHVSAGNESANSIAALLLKHGSDVTLKTSAGTTALSMLVRKLPDMISFLSQRLDSGVTLHDHDPADANCEIKMDFRPILPTSSNKGSFSKKKPSKIPGSEDGSKRNSLRRKETELLTCLVATGNKKLLAHPLSETFLLLKWRRVRKFFVASLLFQMALVALFTVFVVEVYLIRCPYRRLGHNENASSLDVPQPHTHSRRSADPFPGPPQRSRDDSGGFHWFRVVPIQKPKPKTPDYSAGFNPYFLSPQLSSPPLTFPSTPSPPGSGFRHISPNERPQNGIPPAPSAAAVVPISTEMLETEGLQDNQFRTSSEAISIPVEESTETSSSSNSDISEPSPECRLNFLVQGIWLLLIILITLMSIQEIFQFVHSPARYLVSSENWAQWLLIASVMVTAYRKSGDNGNDFELQYWQYPAAACGILMAWGLILFQVGRFPSLGVYVEMLSKVAANFGLFILAYACLLIAFALSFCVLFPEHPPFSSVPLAILKVFTMMVGEVDYEDLFYSEERAQDPLLFPLTAHLLFGAFVLIMTIVLMNLLVGLAVSDIHGLQKGAKLDRLCRQTALINRFESFIFSKKLQTILPARLIMIIQENSLIAPTAAISHPHQTEKLSFHFRPNDPRDRSLPKDIKLAALVLVTSKSSSRNPTLAHLSKQFGEKGKPSEIQLRRSVSSVSHQRSRPQPIPLTSEKKCDGVSSASYLPQYHHPLRSNPPSTTTRNPPIPDKNHQIENVEKCPSMETKLERLEKDVQTILELVRILAASQTQKLLIQSSGIMKMPDKSENNKSYWKIE